MEWPLSFSLKASGKFIASMQARAFALTKVTAIRPDAKTRNRPCRELSRDGSADPLTSLLTVQ
jgi:hypothetical protein